MKNSTRAWIFLSLLSICLILTGHVIAGREGLLWGFALAISINTYAYYYADMTLSKHLHAKKLEGNDSWGVVNTSIRLAQKTRIPYPEVYLFHCETPQALTIGRNWESGKIFLTDSLLQLLTPKELEAIIAYQIINIKSLDSLAFTIGSTLAAGIMYIPQQMDRLLALALGPRWEFQKKGQVFSWLAAPAAALVLLCCFNMRSNLEIDSSAADLIGDKESLARALWKIESYQKTKPHNFAAPHSLLFVVNPLTGRSWTRYFRLQPTTSARIKNLMGYYPL